MLGRSMKKLMAAMMQLVILVLVEVKANDLDTILLQPSPRSIMLSQPSKLDNVQEETFIDCLGKKFEICHNLYKGEEIRKEILLSGFDAFEH